MPAPEPLKSPVPVGQLVDRRLRELKRTPGELAAAVRVSEDYIEDLVAGRGLPPAPGSGLYPPMGKFLRLHRNDLPTCARAQRAAARPRRHRPAAAVERAVLGICDPKVARSLTRRLGRADGAELSRLIVERLLEVAQGFVRNRVEDEMAMRAAASRAGRPYLDGRMRLLRFLDSSAESLTVADCEEFIVARVASWAYDAESGAMRIVLRS